jgi:hypothetical protein
LLILVVQQKLACNITLAEPLKKQVCRHKERNCCPLVSQRPSLAPIPWDMFTAKDPGVVDSLLVDFGITHWIKGNALQGP